MIRSAAILCALLLWSGTGPSHQFSSRCQTKRPQAHVGALERQGKKLNQARNSHSRVDFWSLKSRNSDVATEEAATLSGSSLSDVDAMVLESLLKDEEFIDYLESRNMSLSQADIDERKEPYQAKTDSSDYKSETLKAAEALQNSAEDFVVKMRMAADNFGKYLVSKIVADSQVLVTVVATAAVRAVAATSQAILAPARGAEQRLLGSESSFNASSFGASPFAAAFSEGSANFTLKETLDMLQIGAFDTSNNKNKPSKPLRSFENYKERKRNDWVPRLRPKVVPDAVGMAVDVAKAPGDVLMGGAKAAGGLVDLVYSAQREIQYDQAGIRVNKYLGKAGLAGLPLDEISRLGVADEEYPEQLAGEAPNALGGDSSVSRESARAESAPAQAPAEAKRVAVEQTKDLFEQGTETVVDVDMNGGGQQVLQAESVDGQSVDGAVHIEEVASAQEQVKAVLDAVEAPEERTTEPMRNPVVDVGVGAGERSGQSTVMESKVAEEEPDVVTMIDVDTGEVTIESTITETEEVDAEKDRASLTGPLLRLSLRTLDILLLLLERGATVAFKGTAKLGVAAGRAAAALQWNPGPFWPQGASQRQAPLLPFLEKSRLMRMNDIEGLRRRAKAKAQNAIQAGSNVASTPLLGAASSDVEEEGAVLKEVDLEIEKQLVS